MILYQTNLYSLVTMEKIRCYSEFTINKNIDHLMLNAFALIIEDVYIIQENTQHKAEYEYINNVNPISQCRDSFETSLYSTLKGSKTNLRISVPLSVNMTEEYVLRIIYTPKEENSHINCIARDENTSEIFCFSFFPHFEDSKHDIESIFVHQDNKTLLAPGKLIKKNKKDNLQFCSYLTTKTTHIPFVLGTFKCVDCSQNMIRSKIYIPMEFNIDQELKQDICIILQYLQENFLKTTESIGIVFSQNNIQTVSQNTIFLPISLFPLNGIDQNIYLRKKLCDLFSKMLFCNLRCSDFWLSVSVREYMKNAFMREILGENEIHYRNKMDLEYVFKNDICESSLIIEPDKKNRNDNFIYYSVKHTKTDTFKMIKGRLFLQVLENHLSRAFLEKIMYNTWQKLETDTVDFLKTTKDVSGKDMTHLFDYYIYRPGIIECIITYEIDKKGKVDVYMKQRSTSKKSNANKRIVSDLKLKVFEQEGIFDHKIVNDVLSFQCHYRTKKRKTEKEVKPVQKQDSTHEQPDNEEKKDNTEVSENTGQILFMRGDPGIEQITKITIEQPDYMFTEQLVTEKNVYSQIDAILALKDKACDESIQTLERVLNDTHVFYKIRLMILFFISQIKIEPKTNLHDSYKGSETIEERTYNLGFQRIIQYFVKKNCIPGSTIPKSNDFSVFSAYLIQKYLSNALSISDPELTKKFNDRVLTSKNIIIAFLLNIVKYNSYDDNFLYCSSKDEVYNQNFIANTNYLSCIIESLSYQICSVSKIDLNPILNEFERKRINDITFPSYQNLITASILRSSGRMCYYGVVELNYKLVMELAKKGHFYSVREEAINILCTCYLKQSFDFIVDLFWSEERYFKIFILNTLKSIVEILQGDCFNNEEYANAFNELKTLTSDMDIKFMNFKKFKCLHEKKSTFYDILLKYYYDPIIMEYVTDILYLMENKSLKHVIEEKIVKIEKPSFVIQILLNNVVNLTLPEKMRREIVEHKKKKQEDIIQSFKPPISSPYIIRFHRYDIIELRYDEFINKYFLNIEEYLKRNPQKLSNEDTIRKEDDVSLKCITSGHGSFEYHRKESSLFEKLCKVLGLQFNEGIYEDFLITFCTKYLKRHKYFSRLGIVIKDESDISIYKENLHKQFVSYYVSQKYGSQYYLNSKALENYLEQTINELLLFEPLIGMDDRIHKLCLTLLDDIYRLEDVNNFVEPVDYSGLEIPNYVDIIRVPVDLATIRQRLETGKYFAVEYFVQNIELVFMNCMEFNETGSDLFNVARRMLVSVRELILSKLIPGILKDDTHVAIEVPLDFTPYFILDHNIVASVLEPLRDPELVIKKIHKILLNVRLQKEAAQFTQQIADPKRMVKKAMAIDRMIEKAEQGVYLSVGHVLSDMNLLVKNVVALNGNTSWIVRVCRKMEHYFRKEMFVAFGMRFLTGKKEYN